MNEHPIATILLAAGSSNRMGTSKQLLKVHDGTLLEHALRCAVDSSVEDILVVLGARANEHRSVIQKSPVTIEINNDWELGIGNSLKFGVHKALEHWPETQALLVMVCDQPKLTTAHLNTLVEVWLREHPIAVASRYAGISGVPALFDRGTFSELMNIHDSRGAREVLEKLDAQLEGIPFPGGEVDLDTRRDYEEFLKGS